MDNNLENRSFQNFGKGKIYTIPLLYGDDNEQIGHITVSIDNYLITSDFFNRLKIIVISGFVRNILLASALILIFYYFMTRPLLDIVACLSSIDPATPAKKLVDNDILDLAKIESGKIDSYETEFDLSSFLWEISEVIKIRAKQKGIEFSLEIPDNRFSAVRADEKYLRQVLLNLLGNAVKFTDKGKVSLKVTSTGIENNDLKSEHLFRFQIEDTGAGISKICFAPLERVCLN